MQTIPVYTPAQMVTDGTTLEAVFLALTPSWLTAQRGYSAWGRGVILRTLADDTLRFVKLRNLDKLELSDATTKMIRRTTSTLDLEHEFLLITDKGDDGALLYVVRMTK